MPRPPPPFTASYAEWAAATYLRDRFTTRAHLRSLLMRRADRARAEHGGDRDEAARIVDALLDRLVATGALNDAAYAEAKVERLVRQGVSGAGIRARLAAKGVAPALVKEGLDELRGQGIDPTWAAVCAFVRRRRLGPCRPDPTQRAAERERDLAKLARAGYSYDIARKVLDLAGPEELD